MLDKEIHLSWRVQLIGVLILWGVIVPVVLSLQKREADKRSMADRLDKATIAALYTELHEQQTATQTIMESSGYGYVLLDSQGNVTEWNKVMEDLTGISREEKLGNPIQRIVPKEALQEFYRQFHAVVASNDHEGKLWRVGCDLSNAKTGKITSVKISIRLVRPEDGRKPYAAMGITLANEVVELGDYGGRNI